MKTKLLSIALIGAFTFLLSGWTTMNNGATHTSFNFTEAVNYIVWNPCTMENVVCDGDIHMHGSTTVTPSGNVHLNYHENLQSVTGVGQTTGNSYNYVGVLNENYNGNVGETYLYIFNAKMVSNGDQYNQDIYVHITINANGEMTVDNSIDEITCSN
jgi:hypothetical protein